jgi:hypothetical protein
MDTGNTVFGFFSKGDFCGAISLLNAALEKDPDDVNHLLYECFLLFLLSTVTVQAASMS